MICISQLMQDFFAVCVFERREGKVLSKKQGMIGFLKGRSLILWFLGNYNDLSGGHPKR